MLKRNLMKNFYYYVYLKIKKNVKLIKPMMISNNWIII